MNDATRSLQTCLIAFAEFHEQIEKALRRGQNAKVRLSVQISSGRVLVAQVASNMDFSPTELPQSLPKADETEMEKVAGWFNDWRNDLQAAIEDRRVGFCRLSVAANRGAALNAQTNPSFDWKGS